MVSRSARASMSEAERWVLGLVSASESALGSAAEVSKLGLVSDPVSPSG